MGTGERAIHLRARRQGQRRRAVRGHHREGRGRECPRPSVEELTMADSIDAALGKPDYTALTFPAPPAHRPYVILNMVESLDGRATIEGNERGLGSPVDQSLMRELRVHADVVVNGASTLRASGTSPRLNNAALEAIRIERGKSRVPY